MSVPAVVARPLQLGPLRVWPPVALAPMAGVTNAAFRRLCRRMGAGLYISEMIGARALVDRDERTWALARFPADEVPRSIQLYGTDPEPVRRAVEMLVREERADHVDLNFGCPAPKVTRRGGGAALPFRTGLFRGIVEAAVGAAGAVPVTVKLRKGIDDRHLTFLESGAAAAEAGAAAVTLHARTAEQLYAGRADWSAIAMLKAELGETPVLGNGDIWEAADAIRMMEATGCDGVVVGRGCLGRPWLFQDLAAAFSGSEVTTVPALGVVAEVMEEHARLLVDLFGEHHGVRSFRKHVGWYLKGYPTGPELRRRLADVGSLAEVGALLGGLEPDVLPEEGAARMPRGHTSGPRPVRLPHGYLRGEWRGRVTGEGELAVSGG